MGSSIEIATKSQQLPPEALYPANDDSSFIVPVLVHSAPNSASAASAFLVAGPTREIWVARLRKAGFAARSICSFKNLKATLCPETHSGLILDLTDATSDEIADISLFIRAQRNTTAIVCIVSNPRFSDVVGIMRAGAFDVLQATVSEAAFLTSVQAVADRATEWRHRTQEIRCYRQNLQALTVRERQVFDLMLDGLSTPEIAIRLEISPRTVDIFRGAINRKTMKRPLPQLIRLAVRSENQAATGQVGIEHPSWWRP